MSAKISAHLCETGQRVLHMRSSWLWQLHDAHHPGQGQGYTDVSIRFLAKLMYSKLQAMIDSFVSEEFHQHVCAKRYVFDCFSNTHTPTSRKLVMKQARKSTMSDTFTTIHTSIAPSRFGGASMAQSNEVNPNQAHTHTHTHPPLVARQSASHPESP
jgi:hypothetical protein